MTEKPRMRLVCVHRNFPVWICNGQGVAFFGRTAEQVYKTWWHAVYGWYCPPPWDEEIA